MTLLVKATPPRRKRQWRYPLLTLRVGGSFFSRAEPRVVLNYARVRRCNGEWSGRLAWTPERDGYRYRRVE